MTIAECNAPAADNIIRIIREKGVKQKFVADRTGFSEAQFSAMITGRKLIKSCDVIAIANALEVTPNDLFRKEENDVSQI